MRMLSLREGGWVASDLQNMDEVLAQRDKNELTWFRAGKMSAPELQSMADGFGLHELAIEDIQEPRERPRVEDYPDHTFVIVRVPLPETEDLDWQQIGLFAGDDYVISTSNRPIHILDAPDANLLRKGLPEDRATAGGLLHMIVDAVVDRWVPQMEEMEERSEHLEDEALGNPTQELLEEIRDMKNMVSRFRKILLPMRDALDSLERNRHPNIDDIARIYLRDVADRGRRLVERLEHVRESVYTAQETWNASMANRQNVDMRRLTILFALFLVPTLLASLGGMNFEGMPAWTFWGVTAVILAAFIIGAIAARRAKWL